MMQSAIFTLDVGDRPILAFEAKNLREAWELCHERWLLEDVARLPSDGIPLCDRAATLRSRGSTERERAIYREAAQGAGSLTDELVLAYLVELDLETI
jgi:hypothetical protein